jgi:2',3'-cyclic-nucleotide 2'-phosphodiesterase (5'-nucleotidase family)
MEQIEWLKKEAKSKQFKAAKNKIVLMHIPPIVTDDPNIPEEYTATELEKHFKPLFNELGIDIVISGHTHRHIVAEKGERGNNYPIITNDNEDVMLVNSNKDGINIKIISEKDKVILDRKFK